MKRPAELDDVDRKPGYIGMIFGLPAYEMPTVDPKLTVTLAPFIIHESACGHEWATDTDEWAICALCGARLRKL